MLSGQKKFNEYRFNLTFYSLSLFLSALNYVQVVRRTWGKEGLFQNGVSIRTVFLLGVPRNRTALPLWDRLLTYESETFQDILLWDFEDTFFNLTLKETHFLKWVNSSCPHVKSVCMKLNQQLIWFLASCDSCLTRFLSRSLAQVHLQGRCRCVRQRGEHTRDATRSEARRGSVCWGYYYPR